MAGQDSIVSDRTQGRHRHGREWHLGGGLSSEKFSYGFGASADLQFFVDAPDVGVHRFVADAEFFGDFFVKKSVAQTVQHFLFALREIFRVLGRRSGFLK